MRAKVAIAIVIWSFLPLNSVLAQTPASLPPISPPLAQSRPLGETKVFPVGLNVNRRNIFPSILVRGREDGSQAIDFANWLLPYDAVIQGLKFTAKPLPDGQVELRSPGLVKRIDPTKLRTDPELGLVFSVRDLQDLFQVKAEFNLNEYAIELPAPWLEAAFDRGEIEEAPVVLTGLPRIRAPSTTVTAISQRWNTTDSGTGSTRTTGDFTAIGTVLQGSWFVRANQPNAFESNTWQLAEATYVRETDRQDYIVGSQPPFWLQQGLGDSSDYWGFTTIVRRGFKPPTELYGGTDVRRRLQSNQISRSISGRAAPGTLVRLVQSLSDRPIAEVLVDSSGIYRFDNLQLGNQSFGGFYQVLLYPQGQLTAPPEIRDATFLNPQEQLPEGASVLIASLGANREFNSSSERGDFFGNFSEFRGGVAQRWGLSKYVTVGLGGIYDESPRGLAELYFQPGQFPLRVAVSALSGNGDRPWEVLTDIRFEPSPKFSATFNSDRLSHRLNLNWQLSSNLGVFGSYDSEDAIGGGLQFSTSGRGASTYIRASIDTKNRVRWNIFQYLGALKFTQQGNEVGTLSELSYNFSQDSFQERGHSLIANYETRSDPSDNLLTVAWRYRSGQQASDGNYLWETQLGYGTGSQGSGIIASLGTTIVPGLLLRGRYQEVSTTSDRSSFNLELVSNFNVQQGITPGDRRSDYLRTSGGLSIQPFFDDNQNGKRDAGEAIYLDNPELLIILNNHPLRLLQSDTSGDRVLVRLPPGTVRLDLDPAGFPPDWQATGEAYAVDVVAGSYTPIQVPLIPAYTIAGVVVDSKGQPISGARIEAISTTTGQKVFSVTNDAGVYYLERLQSGTYSLQINGKVAHPDTIKLDRSARPLQELNLTLP